MSKVKVMGYNQDYQNVKSKETPWYERAPGKVVIEHCHPGNRASAETLFYNLMAIIPPVIARIKA